MQPAGVGARRLTEGVMMREMMCGRLAAWVPTDGDGACLSHPPRGVSRDVGDANLWAFFLEACGAAERGRWLRVSLVRCRDT